MKFTILADTTREQTSGSTDHPESSGQTGISDQYVKDRPGHDRRYAIDPTKIETELGWKPKYNFDTGIAQTIQWYLDNEDWWKHIISGEYQNYFAEMYKDRL